MHSSVNRYLVCLHSLAIMNNAAMNIGVQTSLQDPTFNFFGYMPKVKLLGHMIILFLIFLDTTI